MTPELLAASNQYNLPALFKKCEMSLCSSINIANVTTYFLIAYLHEASKLKQMSMWFIIDNYEQIKGSPGMLIISERHPKALLEILQMSTKR
jgi:hypothetical protein